MTQKLYKYTIESPGIRGESRPVTLEELIRDIRNWDVYSEQATMKLELVSIL
jgi:hypothetical protein